MDASEEVVDASEEVAQVPHADLPRWQQAQQLGYDCYGINGCILAVRHQGECVFPEMSDRRRCQVIEPKPAQKEASLAHPKKKKPPKTGASAGSANAGTSSTSTKRTPAPKPTPTPKPAAAAKPAPTPTPTPTAAAAAGDEEEAPDPDDVPCRKCGSRGNAKRMLLCDGEGGTCPAAYHTYCLTPPLLSLPKGDWFCPPCELKRQAGSGMSMRQQMRYLADLARTFVLDFLRSALLTSISQGQHHNWRPVGGLSPAHVTWEHERPTTTARLVASARLGMISE